MIKAILRSFLFLVLFACMDQGISQSVKTVSTSEFATLLNKENIQLVDVRTEGEYQSGHLENAVMIDFKSSDFETNTSQLDKSKPVLLYCASGIRSAKAAQKLLSLGFGEVYDMKGGMRAWVEEGRKTTKD